METVDIFRVESKDCKIVGTFYFDVNDARAEQESLRKMHKGVYLEVKTHKVFKRINFS